MLLGTPNNNSAKNGAIPNNVIKTFLKCFNVTNINSLCKTIPNGKTIFDRSPFVRRFLELFQSQLVSEATESLFSTCISWRFPMAYHLLKKLPVAPTSLSAIQRTTILAAGHVAAGDTAAVIASFQALPTASYDNAYSLAVLQSAAFVGFPRALTAAAALQQAGIVASQSAAEAVSVANLMDPAIAGIDAFDAVYGRAAEKVRGRISACHPLLDQWVIEWVYGRVLSAPGPSLRERELCAVAQLAGGGPGTEPLLVSHLRGALRCGATREELRAVVEHTKWIFGDDAAERTEGVWTVRSAISLPSHSPAAKRFAYWPLPSWEKSNSLCSMHYCPNSDLRQGSKCAITGRTVRHGYVRAAILLFTLM